MKFLLLVLATLGAAQASDQGLVVLDFQSKGILDKSVLRDLWQQTLALASGVANSGALPEEETRRRLFEQNILVPTRCDQACFHRLAEKLHAGRILAPSVEKSGDQLKFDFVLVDGQSGKTLKSASLWSDGRVGRPLAAGIAGTVGNGGPENSSGFPSQIWASVGVGAVGLGAALWFGLEQARTPPSPSPGQSAKPFGSSF